MVEGFWLFFYDKNFGSGMNDNLRQVALTGSTALENRAEYQAAIVMRQPAMGIQITDSVRDVKKTMVETPKNFIINNFSEKVK
jgi:hypothetical protein